MIFHFFDRPRRVNGGGGGGDGDGDGGRRSGDRPPPSGPPGPPGGPPDPDGSDDDGDIQSGDSDAPASRRRRRLAKEADQIMITPIPTDAAWLRSWRMAIRTEVAAASGRGSRAFKWIR